MGSARYDRIGVGYDAVRRPDPRIAELIRDAIGQARSIVNVGAGSGAYEPIDVKTVAIEPSAVMIAQRGPCWATPEFANDHFGPGVVSEFVRPPERFRLAPVAAALVAMLVDGGTGY